MEWLHLWQPCPLPSKDFYSVLHFMILLTKYHPWVFRSQSHEVLPSRVMSPQTCATLGLQAFFHWLLRIFFFQEWKEKAQSRVGHKSAAGNKVMHFTAYDPNTHSAKLAFSHSHWHKMCLDWHFIFTICPSGKIKSVPFSFQGITLRLNSSLNACLCLIIF